MKKVLSVLLAVLLLCGMLPMTLAMPASAGGRTLWLVDENNVVHEVGEEELKGPGWSSDNEVLTLETFTGKALFGYCCGLKLVGENKLNGVFLDGYCGSDPTYISGSGELTVTFDKSELDCSKYKWGRYSSWITMVQRYAVPLQYHDHAFAFDCEYNQYASECHMALNGVTATGGTNVGDSEPLVIADKSQPGKVIELFETADGKAASYVHIASKASQASPTPTFAPFDPVNGINSEFVAVTGDGDELFKVKYPSAWSNTHWSFTEGVNSYILGLNDDNNFSGDYDHALDDGVANGWLFSIGMYPAGQHPDQGNFSLANVVKFKGEIYHVFYITPTDIYLQHGTSADAITSYLTKADEVSKILQSGVTMGSALTTPSGEPIEPPPSEPTPTPPSTRPDRFSDVKSSDWFYNEVEYVAAKGLMTGKSQTSFAPKAETTRAELVVILYRMAGEPALQDTNAPTFSDAKADWYKNAVAWAAENGIVGGYGDGTFRPNRAINREEFAIILARYARYSGIFTGNLPIGNAAPGSTCNLEGFVDHTDISSSARDELTWANEAGIITGVNIGGKNYIQPKGKANRAQTAVMLKRFCEDVLPKAEELTHPVEFVQDGKSVLTVNVPGSWADAVSAETTVNGFGETTLRFCDKLNAEYDGWLFSVRLIPSEKEWYINRSKCWGSIEVDGKAYDVAFLYTSDVRYGNSDEEQASYLTKYVQLGQIFRDGVTTAEGVKNL